MADTIEDKLAGARAVNVVLREMLEAERARSTAYRDALVMIAQGFRTDPDEPANIAREALGKEPTK